MHVNIEGQVAGSVVNPLQAALQSSIDRGAMAHGPMICSIVLDRLIVMI